MPKDFYNLESPKRIRSVERTIEVVECLALKGASTLTELRAKTGLSNSTLLRCLATLHDKGWVRRYMVEGRYELTSKVRSILNSDSQSHLISEIASPLLRQLLNSSGSPSDMAVRGNSGNFTIVETSRTRGKLSPNQTVYGLQPSLLYSALGRAFLANCPEDERSRHLVAIKLNGKPNERDFVNSGRFERILTDTKQRGYSTRENGYWFEPVDEDPGLSEIAVSIGHGTGIRGAVSIVWLASEITLEEIVQNSLSKLRMTASKIFLELTDVESRSPNVRSVGGFSG